MTSEWQDISTAPKGGGAEFVTDQNWVAPPDILLCFRGGERRVGHWDWFYADGGYGCTDGIAWIEPCSGEQLNLYYDAPTHWHLLPAPPAERAETGFRVENCTFHYSEDGLKIAPEDTPQDKLEVCKACHGTGEIEEAPPELSYSRLVGDCAQCGGTGKAQDKPEAK